MLLLLNLWSQVSRMHLVVIISTHLFSLDVISYHDIIPMDVNLVQMIELLITLDLSLSMVHLMTILEVLVGNFFLPIYTIFYLLKMSILIPHEWSHNCIDLLQCLFPIVQIHDQLCIALIKKSIHSASFVPCMLIILRC